MTSSAIVSNVCIVHICRGFGYRHMSLLCIKISVVYKRVIQDDYVFVFQLTTRRESSRQVLFFWPCVGARSARAWTSRTTTLVPSSPYVLACVCVLRTRGALQVCARNVVIEYKSK